jgi:uncharacterized membrane protein YsdA (DUF1294 family)
MIFSTEILKAAFFYLAAISVFAAVITVYDKFAAKSRLRRVPESFLIFIALLGGSAAMLAAMLLIRHKTRHLKFMAGIPLIILLQLCIVLLAVRLIHNG